MTKTRIAYLLFMVFLFQPAFLFAEEKDSGSSFGRRKTQIEKKVVEVEAVTPSDLSDFTKASESTETEKSTSPTFPKPPVEPKNVIQGVRPPPGAPQNIPQLPPSVPGAPNLPKTGASAPNSPPKTFHAPIAQDSTEAPENTDMEASKSPTMPKTPAEPKSVTQVRNRSAIPVTPKLTKTDTRNTSAPNTPPKVPTLPKTK